MQEWGESKITLSDYATQGDSISLSKIGNKEFTIIGIEDSDYTDAFDTVKGVKISTKESFEGVNKLHTTRIAVVNQLSNTKLREDIKNGKQLLVRCEEVKSKKGGKPYYDLVDVVKQQKQEKF